MTTQARTTEKIAPPNAFWVIPLIAVVTAAVYFNALHTPFVFDDIKQIVEKTTIRDLTNFFSLKEIMKPRAIVDFTFAVNYYFSAQNVFGYHLVNVGIHFFNGCLVYFLSLTILTLSAKGMNPLRSRANEPQSSSLVIISLFAALIFVSHPIQTQAVTYIIQRYASMAAFFYLASILLYLKARIIHCHKDTDTSDIATGQVTGGSHPIYVRPVPLYILSIFSAILALLSKQNTASLPGAILLVEYLFISHDWKQWKKRIPWLALASLVWILSMAMVIGVFSQKVGERGLLEDVTELVRDSHSVSRWQYLCTQFNVVVIYLKLLFFPVHQNLDYYYPFKSGFFDGVTPLACALLFIVIALGVIYNKKRPILAFGIFWFFITLAVESSIIPIKDAIFEHRLYLPMFGFAIVISHSLFRTFPKSRGLPVGIALSAILLLGVMTHERNKTWQKRTTLWADVVSKSPLNPRGHYNLGLALADAGVLHEARTEYTRAIALKPDYAEAHNNLGVAKAEQGDMEQAMAHYMKALDIQPDYAEAHNNLGAAFSEQGEIEQATFHYRKALASNPRHVKAHNNLGILLARQGKRTKAMDHFSKALQFDPLIAEPNNNLGLVLLEQGHLDKAELYFNRAIEIKPDYADAQYNLGVVSVHQGNMKKALAHFTSATEINPNHAKAHYNLGITLAREGRLEEATVHFSKALEILPGYVDARSSLEQALNLRKRP